ncbi:MAG: TfoX/Sxy family protein [Planctomycetia bacterium]|nr:TfoX/Sxy family protein [Planctomycetia bacterium]
MAFNEALAERIRQELAHKKGVTEKKLFGCFCFLLHGNVCVGVWQQSLLVRLDVDDYADALKEPCVREFDITGRPLKGWVVVDPAGIQTDEQLKEWIQRAVAFVSKLRKK